MSARRLAHLLAHFPRSASVHRRVGTAPAKQAENAPVAVAEVEKVKKPKGRIAEYNDDNWDEEVAQEKKADFSGLKVRSPFPERASRVNYVCGNPPKVQ